MPPLTAELFSHPQLSKEVYSKKKFEIRRISVGLTPSTSLTYWLHAPVSRYLQPAVLLSSALLAARLEQNG